MDNDIQMNYNNENSPNQNPEQKSNSLKDAMITFNLIINLILALPLIFSFLRELDKNMDFIKKYPKLSTIIFISFVTIFVIAIRNIIKEFIIKKKKKVKKFIITKWNKIEDTKLGKIINDIIKITRKKIFILLTVLTSLIALILISVALFNFHIKGVYYAQISSFRTEKAAVEEILSINRILINKGEKDYRARAYKAKNGYIVTFGQFYFKEESAYAALAKAEDIIPGRVDGKGIVVSSEKPFFRRLKLFLKKIF
jgi:hypothetical protein